MSDEKIISAHILKELYYCCVCNHTFTILCIGGCLRSGEKINAERAGERDNRVLGLRPMGISIAGEFFDDDSRAIRIASL